MAPHLWHRRIGHRAPSLRRRQARNSLNSFFGGDRGERLLSLLGAEDADQLSRESLQALAEQSLTIVGEGVNEFLPWFILQAVLGDLPPYENLADQLKTVLLKTDFVGLFERDLSLGVVAIQTASLQAINLCDAELHQHLKDQLVKIARLCADQDTGEMNVGAVVREKSSRPEGLYALMLESALNVSRVVQALQDIITEFIDLITQLLEAWPSLISVLKPIVQRLCEELPVSQAHEFWPLLIRLRAE